jgi:hypothetical protein
MDLSLDWKADKHKHKHNWWRPCDGTMLGRELGPELILGTTIGSELVLEVKQTGSQTNTDTLGGDLWRERRWGASLVWSLYWEQHLGLKLNWKSDKHKNTWWIPWDGMSIGRELGMEPVLGTTLGLELGLEGRQTQTQTQTQTQLVANL